MGKVVKYCLSYAQVTISIILLLCACVSDDYVSINKQAHSDNSFVDSFIVESYIAELEEDLTSSSGDDNKPAVFESDLLSISLPHDFRVVRNERGFIAMDISDDFISLREEPTDPAFYKYGSDNYRSLIDSGNAEIQLCDFNRGSIQGYDTINIEFQAIAQTPQKMFYYCCLINQNDSVLRFLVKTHNQSTYQELKNSIATIQFKAN